MQQTALAFGKAPQHGRIQPMLLHQHTRGQGICRVPRQDGHAGLAQHGAGIEIGRTAPGFSATGGGR